MNETKRLQGLQSRIHGWGVDGVLLFSMPTIRYLTGFTGSEGVLYAGADAAILLVDGRYTTQAGDEFASGEVREFSDRAEAIAELVRGREAKSVGFESAALYYDSYAELSDRMPGVTLKAFSDELNTLRIRKDEEEITTLRRAAEIAGNALAFLLEMIQPDVVERDIVFLLESAMRERGADRPSFDTIIASGRATAMPHAKPRRKKIERGDCLVIDYGAAYEGYNSDETCTFIVGNPTAEQREAYTAVKDAHDRAIDAVKAGVPASEIDRVARAAIEEKGFGRYFSHGTGHGVGLEVHEPPRLSKKSADLLEAGMVVTVEPGVYIPGLWGIRIEDMVVVRENGCEVLTTMSKELTVL